MVHALKQNFFFFQNTKFLLLIKSKRITFIKTITEYFNNIVLFLISYTFFLSKYSLLSSNAYKTF